MRVYEGWAPPGNLWGPYVEIGSLVGGPLSFRVEFDTISQAPSSFDAEVKYWRGNEQVTEIIPGPGNHNFIAGICVCIQRIRFRSHTLGQIVRIRVAT